MQNKLHGTKMMHKYEDKDRYFDGTMSSEADRFLLSRCTMANAMMREMKEIPVAVIQRIGEVSCAHVSNSTMVM